MARFLVTYHANEMPHDPESMAQARAAFMEWAERTGAVLVEPGAPVASTMVVSASGAGDGSADTPLNGWSVIEAEDADAVVRILSDHPFIGRGGVLQINQPVVFP